jgi:hypothetical protein
MMKKKRIKWTDEMLFAEAKKYRTRVEFVKGSNSAYQTADHRGILHQACAHMVKPVRERKWTKQIIQAEALKYQKKSDFNNGCRRAYGAAYKMGILDEVCSHMQVFQRDWTMQMLKYEALKYETRTQFENGSSGAYQFALRRGILDEICSHMVVKKINWSNETIRTEALKYETRSEFIKGSPGAYGAARRLAIINSVCSHMKVLQTDWTKEEAHAEALKYETRVEFQNSSGAYQFALRSECLDEICTHMVPFYSFWTDESAKAEALKYKTRTDFSRGSSSAYRFLQKRGLLGAVCSHMTFDEKYTDNDTIYIWKSDFIHSGLEVYKFGITSKRRGLERIREVAKMHRTSFDVVLIKEVSDALRFENMLRRIGILVPDLVANGGSEFRAWTPHEFQTALEVLREA